MKKIIAILTIMTLFTMSSFSQTWYKTTSVSVKIGSRSYSDWYSCPSTVKIDVDAKTIKIWNDINISDYDNGTFSIDHNDYQLFYYSGISTYFGDGYKMETTRAYDKNMKWMTVQFFIWTNGNKFLLLQYGNIIYQYKLINY